MAVFFISRLRILQVSPLATLQTHHLRHHIDIDHLRLHNSHRTGKTYWTLHSSLLSINPWVFDAPLSSNLDPESPRSDCGSTAGASTNRSILQSEKRPKIILNTYSEGFFGGCLRVSTVLLDCSSIVAWRRVRGHGEGTTCKTLSHVKHYICTQRLFELTRVPNLQSNFNLSPVTGIFWLLNCPSPTPSFARVLHHWRPPNLNISCDFL